MGDERDWVAGFFDAEGYLGMGYKKTEHGRVGVEIGPRMVANQGYVAGFIDGDGTIRPVVAKGNTKIDYRADPQIDVRESTNRAIEAMASYYEDNNIRYSVGTEEREGRADLHYIRVNGYEQVKEALLPIRDNLIVKRPQAEILLDRIIPLMEDGKHLERLGFLEVMIHVSQLNKYHGKNTQRKYTYHYFKDEWVPTHISEEEATEIEERVLGTPL